MVTIDYAILKFLPDSRSLQCNVVLHGFLASHKKKKNEAKAEQYLFGCSAVCYTAQSDTNFLVRVKSQSVAIQ